MASTVWKGHLTFGLVSIPVRLYRAARAERVSLRQLYRPSGPRMVEAPAPVRDPGERGAKVQAEPQAVVDAPVAPVKRVYQAATANGGERAEPIPASDLVKGYEVSKGEYVVLEEQELRSVAPKTSTEMEIVEFVRFNEIDPVYLETSYYVGPDEGGEKAYALLLQGMQETGYAALGQVTMHRRDHVMIVRPGKTGLVAHTMFYADEVRSMDEFRTDTSLVAAKELELAKALIQALATTFEPAKFKNQFRERLRALIDSRSAVRAATPVETPAAGKVIDIMDALKRSLNAAKSATQADANVEALKPERKPAAGERSAKADRGSKTQKR